MGRRGSSVHPEIFRATTTQRILADFAMVFAQRIDSKDLVGLESQDEDDSMTSDGETYVHATAHEESDGVFFNSIECDRVDVFISHAWAAGRWQKYIALCYYFNTVPSVVVTVIVWFSLSILY